MKRSRISVGFCLTMVLTLAANAYSTSVKSFDTKPYMSAQQTVDVGGRHMNLYCTGHGQPTVVLEAGSGGDTLDWRFVQPLVAAHTRVCSYDRAGAGFSDVGPLPRDADAIVSDLRTLVTRGHIVGPLVLVGHSDGARYVRIYADRYLRDVSGLVFVEPALDAQDEHRAEAIAPKYAEDTDEAKTIDRACALAEAQHRLQQGTPEYNTCVPEPYDDLPPAMLALTEMQTRRAGWWKSYVSEYVDDGATAREVRKQQRSYGDLPLMIFMADDTLSAQTFPGKQAGAVMSILRESRTALTHLSSRGSLLEARACRQDETTQCAAKVAATIDSVVAKVRSRL